MVSSFEQNYKLLKLLNSNSKEINAINKWIYSYLISNWSTKKNCYTCLHVIYYNNLPFIYWDKWTDGRFIYVTN